MPEKEESNYLTKSRHSKREVFFSNHLAVDTEMPEAHMPINCRYFIHEETKHISQNLTYFEDFLSFKNETQLLK